MITIGLDTSMTSSGVSVIKDGKAILRKTIPSKPSGKTPLDELIRLVEIVDQIEKVVSEYRPDIAAIEGVALHAIGSVSQLSALNYFTRRMFMSHGIPFLVVAPTSLKKFITGKGVGPKDVMMLEIFKKYEESFSSNDMADAFALARVAYDFKSGEKLVKYQQEVIDLLKKQLS